MNGWTSFEDERLSVNPMASSMHRWSDSCLTKVSSMRCSYSWEFLPANIGLNLRFFRSLFMYISARRHPRLHISILGEALVDFFTADGAEILPKRISGAL
jgi:hypothetical protein